MYLHVWVLYIRVVCTGSDVMSESPGCPRRPVPRENSYYLPLTGHPPLFELCGAFTVFWS